MRRGDWLYTFSGRRVYLIDPRPGEIDLLDIAHALSQQCRFTGHTKQFYSVAEHCCRTHDAVAADRTTTEDIGVLCSWALLHDAAEAYIGDMNRPLKRGCGDVGDRFQEVEEHLLEVIAEKFMIPLPIPHAVELYDLRMLVTEARQVYDPPAPWALEGFWSHIEPLPTTLAFWAPREAEEQFMHRADALGIR